MNRIDDIVELEKKCIGCMACVDVCPSRCISTNIGRDGFKYSVLESSKCISCGKCYAVCPLIAQKKHNEEQHLFAAYSKDVARRNNGSSGGIFEILANYFIDQGYYVCGAAFEGTILKHRVVGTKHDIEPLLKSKYIQSDTEGIYKQILEILKRGDRVFFCGTPCQVAAMINLTPISVKNHLFTADIICHGVPSQTVFNAYIETLEKKHDGKVSDFSFRVKDNKYRHAHGYSYKVTKNEKTFAVNGIYTSSSFYNAFKKYLIFRNGCYDCQYSTLQRVSDITLADFWGIEKYDFDGDVDTGVSMVITNTTRGHSAFTAIEEKVVFKEYPIQYGIDSNYCLTHKTKKPRQRDEIIERMSIDGYEMVAREYFKSSLIYNIYWQVPPKVRRIIRKIRGK